MAVRQAYSMPLSLGVWEPTRLRRSLHGGVSFVLDEKSKGLPLIVTAFEGDENQPVQVTFDPDQPGCARRRGKRAAMQYPVADGTTHLEFVRYNSRSTWHLRKCHAGGQLCTTRPRYEPTAIAVIDAGGTLWHESVCAQWTQVWTQQIHSRWIRSHYAFPTSPSPSSEKGHEP